MPPCEGEATVARNLKILDTARATGLKAVIQDSRMPLSFTGNNTALANPLDQLSSADIAQSVANLANLPEATAVRNQAETVNAELAVAPAQNAVTPKPQVVTTTLKSRKDIQRYTTQSGDTIASLAAKFDVTSNSIKWSNSLIADTISPGTSLVIPPTNGIVYTVKDGDTAQSIAQRYSANAEQITAFNDAELGGLQSGEQILIPNGQTPTVAAPVVYAASLSSSATFRGAAVRRYTVITGTIMATVRGM